MLSLVLAALAAAPLPKAAVLGVRAEEGVSPGTASTLTRLLTEELARSGKYEVFSAQELAVLLGVERQRELSRCADDACLKEIGSALGADTLFDGSIGALGNLRVLSLRVIDGKKSVVEKRESVTVDDESRLADGLRELVAKVLGLAPAPSASRSKAPFVLLGAGAVFAIAGVAVGVAALGSYNGYKLAPESADRSAMHANARLLGGVADGLYGAALLTAVIAVVLFIVASGGS